MAEKILVEFQAAGLDGLTADLAQASNATEKYTKSNTSLKAELRAVTEELATMLSNGEKNSAKFKELTARAGQLDDAMKDARAAISQAGSDTRGLDKALRAVTLVTAGFAAVQGAAALFGKENENLQKTLVKVNGAMAILAGLQEIQNELLRPDSILTNAAAKAKQFYTYATTQATRATQIFMGVLSGGLLVVLGLVIANWDKLTASMNRNKKAVDDLKKSQEDLKVQQQKQLAQLQTYEKLWKAAGKTEKEIYELRIDQAKKFQQENTALIAKAQREIDKIRKNASAISDDKEAIDALTASITELQEANFILQGDIAGSQTAIKELNKETKKETKEDEKKLSLLEQLQKQYQETAAAITDLIAKATVTGRPVDQTQIGKLTNKAYELANQIEEINAGVEKLLKHGKEDATEPILPILIGTDPASKANIEKDFDEINKDIDKKIEEGRKKKERDDAEQRKRERAEEIANASAIANSKLQIAAQLNGQLSAIVSGAFANQQAELEEQRAKGLITEKQYQREVAKLKQKQAKADKAASLTQAIINGAMAVTNALATVPFPGGFVVAALAAAMAAAQVAIIAKQKIPQFRHGVIDLKGPGTATSDSITARLSKGESVMTAEETQRHKPALMAMRKKNFDKVYIPVDEVIRKHKPMSLPSLQPTKVEQNGGMSEKLDKIYEELVYQNIYTKEGNRVLHKSKDHLSTLTKKRNAIRV